MSDFMSLQPDGAFMLLCSWARWGPSHSVGLAYSVMVKKFIGAARLARFGVVAVSMRGFARVMDVLRRVVMRRFVKCFMVGSVCVFDDNYEEIERNSAR